MIDLAHRVRRRLYALLGVRTRGVKMIVCDAEGAVLLIRHRYGRTDLYALPGGGIARGESAEAAAVRELAEETGCAARDVAPFARYEARTEGRRDTVHLFTCRTDDAPRADGVEVAEARFFAPDALPAATSPATRARLAEWRGERAVDGRW